MTSLPGSRTRRSAEGFTLAELLAVLAIISLVGGLSAGAFQLARRQYALAASASAVETAIRSARNSAISSGVPTRVVVDSVEGVIAAYAFETVGEWGFEEVEGGAARGLRGGRAELRGGASVGPGHAGQGLDLSGKAHADCGAAPIYDLRGGVQLEAWIRIDPEAKAAEATERRPASGSGVRARAGGKGKGASALAPLDDAAPLLAKGKAYFLGLARDGALEGRIGDFRVRTGAEAVRPGRWTRVALHFDGESLRLLVDGIAREAISPDRPTGKEAPPCPESIPLTLEPFVIGAAGGGPALAIDEVAVRGLAAPVRHELGPRERFLGWRKVIRFDRRGRLDPTAHESAVRVILSAADSDPEVDFRTTVAVDRSVTYPEYARRRGIPVLEGAEEAEEEKLREKYSAERQIIISVDLSGAIR